MGGTNNAREGLDFAPCCNSGNRRAFSPSASRAVFSAPSTPTNLSHCHSSAAVRSERRAARFVRPRAVAITLPTNRPKKLGNRAAHPVAPAPLLPGHRAAVERRAPWRREAISRWTAPAPVTPSASPILPCGRITSPSFRRLKSGSAFIPGPPPATACFVAHDPHQNRRPRCPPGKPGRRRYRPLLAVVSGTRR